MGCGKLEAPGLYHRDILWVVFLQVPDTGWRNLCRSEEQRWGARRQGEAVAFLSSANPQSLSQPSDLGACFLATGLLEPPTQLLVGTPALRFFHPAPRSSSPGLASPVPTLWPTWAETSRSAFSPSRSALEAGEGRKEREESRGGREREG